MTVSSATRSTPSTPAIAATAATAATGAPTATTEIARPLPGARGRARSTLALDAERPCSVAVLGARAKVVATGSRDARIAAIATEQRGRVSRRQLLAAGLTPSTVERLRRTDRLFQLHAGVYAVGHPGAVPLGDETAALLAVPDGALLTHRSAARVWGLGESASDTPPGPGLVHVLVGTGETVRRTGIRAHRSRLITRGDRRVHQRLPVCTAARTLLDLAVDVEDRPLRRMFDRALIAGTTRPGALAELLARAAGHPGAARLRELAVDGDDGVTRSEAEAQLLELIRAADLPRPRVNSRLHGYEVDLLWPQAQLAVEVDGFRFHSTRAAFERDRVRDARLQAAGIEVLRVTWRQLQHEPFTVIARIATALARRTGTER